jgi:hypothetical protein
VKEEEYASEAASTFFWIADILGLVARLGSLPGKEMSQ